MTTVNRALVLGPTCRCCAAPPRRRRRRGFLGVGAAPRCPRTGGVSVRHDRRGSRRRAGNETRRRLNAGTAVARTPRSRAVRIWQRFASRTDGELPMCGRSYADQDLPADAAVVDCDCPKPDAGGAARGAMRRGADRGSGGGGAAAGGDARAGRRTRPRATGPGATGRVAGVSSDAVPAPPARAGSRVAVPRGGIPRQPAANPAEPAPARRAGRSPAPARGHRGIRSAA
jgi:hypothetical protein